MFLFLLPCYPPLTDITLPIPSVPIIDATFQQILILVFLLPHVFTVRLLSELQNKNIILYLPILYLLGTGLLEVFSSTIDQSHTRSAVVIKNTWTNQIRNLIYLLIFTWLPFYMLAVWIDSDRKLLQCFKAIMYSGLILAVLAIPCAILNWDIYREIAVASGTSQRSGFIRLALSLGGPTKLGFYLTIILALMIGVLLSVKQSMLRYALLCALILPGLYFTGSRGAWIGFVLVISAFVYFKMPNNSRIVTTLFIVLSISIISVGYIWQPQKQGFDISSLDESGTFDYRKRLAQAEIQLIKQHPFFGHPNPFQTPIMEELRQGQGIIDPVNAFLTLGMTKGLIYLFFLLVIIATCVFACLRYVNSGYLEDKKIRVYLGACLAALIISLSVQWIFTSYSGLRVTYFWLVLGMAMALKKKWKRPGAASNSSIDFGLVKG